MAAAGLLEAGGERGRLTGFAAEHQDDHERVGLL